MSDEILAALQSVAEALRLADAEKYDETKWDAFISHIDRKEIERLTSRHDPKN